MTSSTSFSFSDFRGEIADRFTPRDLEAELRRLMDPSSAVRSVHWGRNYLYEALMHCSSGEERVVVKVFRNEGAVAKLRRRLRGSKAERSWRASLAMLRADIAIPEPVALMDSERLGGPSFFVSRHLECQEARYFFRALNAGREQEMFPEIDVDDFVTSLGRMLRRLHDADLWHRDISPGNVLIGDAADGHDGVALFLVDLNRTRAGRRLSLSERMRDLSRVPLFLSLHQARFLESYWGDQEPERGRVRYLFFHRGFLAKNAAKKTFRGLPSKVGRLLPRTKHLHIEPAADRAGARDRIVWDPLTDQPHQHAGRIAKLRVRLHDSGAHLGAAASMAARLPATIRRYREIRSNLMQARSAWGDPGISVTIGDSRCDEIEAALEPLKTKRVLLRLLPWQDLGRSEELARRLHERGYELAFAVPQNRDLVRDLGRWRAALEEIDERFLDLGHDVQVGQAINRSKWGIWNQSEYESLMAVAGEVLRRRSATRILGPAVIDFEFHSTAMVLNSRSLELRYDVVSSLLYVDRRGAPENRQAGFDTIAKVALLKAVVAASRHGDRPCWITEVNWPLPEGPHSPAGREVVVDEESQANYLVRYYLLTLGTGLIERVYWWQLVARGYGLAHRKGESMVYRPSYRAFQHMAQRLSDGELRRLDVPGDRQVYLYLLTRRDGSEVAIAWSVGDTGERLRLPRPASAVFSRDGNRIAGPTEPEVNVTPSPTYYELVS